MPVELAPLWVRNALLQGDSEIAGRAPYLGLDRLKGIAHAPDLGEGCKRWDRALLLRWERREISGYVRGRCKATNQCRYCQRLYTAETVEMLILDALEHTPTSWSVLTAREHLSRPQFNEHLRVIRRALRRSYPEWEYFVAVEFQHRGGPTDGLHGNLIHKGVPPPRFAGFHAELVRRWCDRVDAEPVGQWGRPARDGVAVMKYVTKTLAHGLKAEQAPPIGWKGHRTSQSRGYLVRPAALMRLEARESLQRRSLLAKVEREAPSLSAADRHAEVEILMAESRASWWCLIGPLHTVEKADALVALGEIANEGGQASKL
jgi:hypothetical protein